MRQDAAQERARDGWRALLRREWLPTLAVLLGGVLLQSMNVLMLTTVLPSIVGELGGVAMLSWPTTAFLAAAIVAASCAGLLAARIGARMAYCLGVAIFGCGALLCSLAPTMDWIVAGRLVQGFGGGVEVATAYVVLRGTVPEALWARTIALMSGSWSMSVLIGPLVGGLFARFGHWRGAFVATAAVAAILMVAAFFTLPKATPLRRAPPRVPAGRVALICAAIAATSAASIAASPVAQAGLIALAVAALAAMLRLDRAAAAPLLPRDAFSWRTRTGVGLCLVLLLCVTYSPLQIYVPMFLQHLHGLDPLAAGLTVASASLGWTAASLLTAGVSPRGAERLILAGPAVMAAGLLAIALLAPLPATWPLIPAIMLLGIGIGQCWPFVAQRVMGSARPGEEAVAAAAVPTIQQMGFALGAALAGLAANASGLAEGIGDAGMIRAAFWVPASFVLAAAAALVVALRLHRLRQRRGDPAQETV